MSRSDHPVSFDDFIYGRLSDAENEAILAHLVTCEACEAELERVWSQVPIANTIPSMASPRPQDEADSARSLFRKIHRSDLGGQVVKLYTQGFISLIAGILRPIVGGFRSSK